jgi:hypothetical protein
LQEICHGGEALEDNIRLLSGMVTKRPHDLASSGIAVGVQHAVAAMRAFAGEHKLASVAIESRAPFDKLLNGSRAFLYQDAYGVNIAEPVSGENRVLFVQLDFIVIT